MTRWTGWVVRSAAIMLAALTACIPSPIWVDTARAGTAPGQFGIRLLDVPVYDMQDPRASQYIIDQLTAGRHLSRRIQVSNVSNASLHLSLYAAGASIANGTFNFADGAAANQMSSWTTLSESTLTLAPQHAATVVVNIDIPAGARPGERYAVVWAQATSAGSAGSVTEVNRVGVRVYIDVTGEGKTVAQTGDFEIGPMIASRDKRPAVTAAIHNTGTRAIDLGGTLTLTDGPGGLMVAPVAADSVKAIAPGEVELVRFTLGASVPAGPWRATMALASGDIHHDESAKITFPDGTRSVVPIVERVHRDGYPHLWPLELATALIAGCVVVLVWRARLRGHGE